MCLDPWLLQVIHSMMLACEGNLFGFLSRRKDKVGHFDIYGAVELNGGQLIFLLKIPCNENESNYLVGWKKLQAMKSIGLEVLRAHNF